MLVPRTRLNAHLVALLLSAILITVSSSASSRDKKVSQTAPRHATKSPAATNSSRDGIPRPIPAPRVDRVKTQRTKGGVMAAGNSSLSRAGSRTSEVVGYPNVTVAAGVSHHEPFRDGIYVANTKKPGSKHKDKPQFWQAEIQVGCKELQARRYITDGFCTSFKPILEVVCTGHCLPENTFPWYAEFVKTIGRHKLKEWHCVEDLVQKRPIELLCQDGTKKRYNIKVVKSCKCKKQKKRHNRTNVDQETDAKKTRRKGKTPKDTSTKGS